MINMAHKEGDVCIQLVEITSGIYEITLQEGSQGVVAKETTASYTRAVYEYLRFIANECALNQPAIESAVIIEQLVRIPTKW